MTSSPNASTTPAPAPPAAAAALPVAALSAGELCDAAARPGLHARWTCRRLGRVLVVECEDGGTSLREDAPVLVADLARAGALVEGVRIACRDGAGEWTELLVADGRFAGLRRLGSLAD